MTRRVPLPTNAEVLHALAELRKDSTRPGTVRGLAEHLGLTNSTFWRWFPAIAQDIADQRRTIARAKRAEPSETARRADSERALRAENATLRDQIDLAVAHIQRLTLENHTLRAQMEDRAQIARLPPRP